MGENTINQETNNLSNFYNIHKKNCGGIYPDKWLDLTWTHTLIIWEVAQIIVDNLNKKGIYVNMDLLKSGVLLHDLGVYSCFDEDLNPDKNLPEYVYHGFIGYDLILKEGFSEKVARFSITHTATGLTVEDIERDQLKVDVLDYIPVTLEEEILCFSDKFHSKYPSFSTYDDQVERISKFDSNRRIKMDTFKRKFGIPDLSELHNRYDKWNTDFDKWYEKISNK